MDNPGKWKLAKEKKKGKFAAGSFRSTINKDFQWGGKSLEIHRSGEKGCEGRKREGRKWSSGGNGKKKRRRGGVKRKGRSWKGNENNRSVRGIKSTFQNFSVSDIRMELTIDLHADGYIYDVLCLSSVRVYERYCTQLEWIHYGVVDSRIWLLRRLVVIYSDGLNDVVTSHQDRGNGQRAEVSGIQGARFQTSVLSCFREHFGASFKNPVRIGKSF